MSVVNYVETELGERYIGPRPREFDRRVAKRGGICSKKVASDDDSLTFLLGPPFSDGWGRAVLTTRGERWSLEYTPFDEGG